MKGILIAIFRTDEEIISLVDPWRLALAVGFMNGTVYPQGFVRTMDFDTWFHLLNKRGLPRPLWRCKQALRVFARAHYNTHMQAVYTELSKGRAEGDQNA